MELNPNLVTLVNEADEVIGEADKLVAHRWPAQLHRASSVFLFRDGQTEPELLMQQRSAQKIVGAMEWANTCCGNVWPGESYLACAQRRLDFELGVRQADLTQVGMFRYQVQCNAEFGENEIDSIWIGQAVVGCQPNPAEVAEVAWVPWSLVQHHTPLVPWLTLMLKSPVIRPAIENWLAQNKLIN